MKRKEIGSLSLRIAKEKCDGFFLGRWIINKLAGRETAPNLDLGPEIIQKITPEEIIDSIETLENAQYALVELVREIERLTNLQNPPPHRGY